MAGHEPSRAETGGVVRFSYYFMIGLLLLVILLHLATPLVAALFSYLALQRLTLFRRRKWLPVLVFVVMLGGITYGLGYFINHTVRALPEIADKAIPSIIDTARQRGIELPFTDYDSLRDYALDTIRGEMRYLADAARFARAAATHLLFIVAGAIIAISIFLNPQFDLSPPRNPTDVYYGACIEISQRFQTLYQSFVTVMGAQIIISAINTVLTAIFVLATGLPYAVVVIGATFLCGLLPVIGNLVSNTVVVAIGFTVSPKMALIALVFLVVIHKLEYFLNSKIVGWRIRNPLWLTLLGLIVGERLLGIPGMILAPVVLNYIKLETSGLRPARSSRLESVLATTDKTDA